MFRRQTTFPMYDTKLEVGLNHQLTIGHNMEKRLAVIVTKLPAWGHKGVTVEIMRGHLNKILRTNFNHNHMRYALDRLVNFDVIGKRDIGDEAAYYARPTTASRWEKVRIIHRGK